MERQQFDLGVYLNQIRKLIDHLFSKPVKTSFQQDLFFLEEERLLLQQSLALKQFQMKYGELWQNVLGNYDQFENLGNGHPTGLDVLSRERKLIIELKNSWNTDNSSSRTHNYKKLSNFKKQNPEFTVIYGVINDKTLKGTKKNIYFEDTEILYLSGQTLFDFLLGENASVIVPQVIHLVKEKKKFLQMGLSNS